MDQLTLERTEQFTPSVHIPEDSRRKLISIIEAESAKAEEGELNYAQLMWEQIVALAEEWERYEKRWELELPRDICDKLHEGKNLPVTRRIKRVARSKFFHFDIPMPMPEGLLGQQLASLTEWEYYLLLAATINLRDNLSSDIAPLVNNDNLFCYLLNGGGPDRPYPPSLHPELQPFFWALPLAVQQQWYDNGIEGPPLANTFLSQAQRLHIEISNGHRGVASEAFRRAGDHTRPLGDALQASLVRAWSTRETSSEITDALAAYHWLSQTSALALTQGQGLPKAQAKLWSALIQDKPVMEYTYELLHNPDQAGLLVRHCGLPLRDEEILRARSFDQFMADPNRAQKLEYYLAALMIAGQLQHHDPLQAWRKYLLVGEVSLPGNHALEADWVFLEGHFEGMWKLLNCFPVYPASQEIWNHLGKWDQQYQGTSQEVIVHLVEVKSKLGFKNMASPSVFLAKHHEQMLKHLLALQNMPWKNIRWDYNVLILHPFGNTLLPNRELAFTAKELQHARKNFIL